ncbi:MAG: M23 family peptidase [Rhodobacteraceae bacterium HLUCCA12]|nr:MAG: M23 family peptidase [Rhodobacteraceae bacterium HLUCCA12]
MTPTAFPIRLAPGRAPLAITALAFALSACGGGDLDWDLRRGNTFSTAEAARQAESRRPEPDERGVISYSGYQVAVARRGDTVRDVAQRLGVDAEALARHNAIDTDTVLRGGETLVLPSRVSTDGGDDSIAVTALDDDADRDERGTAAPSGDEPVRHEVERGETVFTIARLYDVSARSLAEWNGLPADMSVREGQILIVPMPQSISDAAQGRTAARPQARDGDTSAPAELPGTGSPLPPPEPEGDAEERSSGTSAPGQGSPTPAPPSSSQPLPEDDPEPAGQGDPDTEERVADMSGDRTEGAQLAMPVEGRIIRAYEPGSNDGIGIGAPAGTPVRAAAGGTVAAITEDTDQVPILVIRHESNLLTVYANIDDIRVERGDNVSRGQTIATVRQGDPSFLHFEVRDGFDSVDPVSYLQ